MHGAPLYIAETCPSQIRGTLISLKELFIVLGILVCCFLKGYLNTYYSLKVMNWSEQKDGLFCSLVILWEAFRLMQLVDGGTCMGSVLRLHY